jgi:peptidoglycan/xylan/chitin deacetylase (PgdA/CDA1 family)
VTTVLNRAATAAVAAAFVLSAASACSASAPSPVSVRQEARDVRMSARPPVPEPAAVGANELGVVPVLMYHRITATPASVYDRTPTAFHAELVRMALEGYVPVTAARYVDGDLDVPAGTHPVVLTFDDGDPSQFALDAAGEPVAGTAVSIMREVAAEFPDFQPVATFFVNADPFGDPGGRRTLPWLAARGMEVGNHTATHANLAQSTPDQVRQEILAQDKAIRLAVPGAAPTTLALPYGARPADPALALTGAGYSYRGAFLVGAGPAPSPHATDFDPAAIPRIRSQDATGEDATYCSTVWLDTLAAAPGQRYTSDGRPDRVSYPRTTDRAPSAGVGDLASPY